MSREAELSLSLQAAWAELERKQGYLQNAVESATALQQELDALRAASPVNSSESNPALQSALEEAWAELEKKQQYLENSFEEIRLRDVELEALRHQIGEKEACRSQASGLLEPKVQVALQQAWEDLEARDALIVDLNAEVSAQRERIEWLLLENKTLSNAIGVDRMRQ